MYKSWVFYIFYTLMQTNYDHLFTYNNSSYKGCTQIKYDFIFVYSAWIFTLFHT